VRLVDAQANFVRFRAFSENRRDDVRPPLLEELPPDAPWPDAR